MSQINRIIGDIIGYKNVNKVRCIKSIRQYNKFNEYKDKKKILYLLVPSHKNMGDQAIAYATRKFFDKYFSEYEVIEVLREEIYRYYAAIKNITNADDLVFIHGGGNLGNLYKKEEITRRFIVDKFKDNKIISMTQTMYFTDDEDGRREAAETAKIYNSHKDLTLIAREDKSYNTMKKLFTNVKILEYPDIVFSLEDLKKREDVQRKYITTCFRDDKESIIDKEAIIRNIKSCYKDIYEIDTMNDKDVYEKEREDELYKLFNKFFKSKVIITDRLHGMIFCVITKTPCIVTKSMDHKITESYKWIKDLNYIRLIDDLSIDNIVKNINELLNLNELSETSFNEKYFSKLKNDIL